MNRNQTTTLIVAIVAGSMTLITLAGSRQSPSTPQGSVGAPARTGVSRRASPVDIARINRLNELNREAVDAEGNHDYVLAEADIKDWLALNNDNPVQYGVLAKFYDRRGRDRDAYAAWLKLLTADKKLGYSSDQNDPGVLARFGELARKFGSLMQARSAYTKASSRVVELTFARMQSVSIAAIQDELGVVASLSAKVEANEVSRTSPGVKTLKVTSANPAEVSATSAQVPLADLRAAALYTSALWIDGHGDSKPALEQMRDAVAVEPDWALAHVGMAWMLQRNGQEKESAAEYQKAESLAQPEMKKFIHSERVRLGFVTGAAG